MIARLRQIQYLQSILTYHQLLAIQVSQLGRVTQSDDYIDSPDGRVLSIDGGGNMLYRASDGEALIVQGIVGYNGRAYDETLSWSSVKAS